jgi:hypothetical protein
MKYKQRLKEIQDKNKVVKWKNIFLWC